MTSHNPERYMKYQGEENMNCGYKRIPKECVKQVYEDQTSAYYQKPNQWCIGCRKIVDTSSNIDPDAVHNCTGQKEVDSVYQHGYKAGVDSIQDKLTEITHEWVIETEQKCALSMETEVLELQIEAFKEELNYWILECVEQVHENKRLKQELKKCKQK